MASINTNNNSPKLWKEFFVNNQRYWIQNVEKSHYDVIANAMGNNFTVEEPIGKYSDPVEHEVIKQKFSSSTKEVLQKGTTIVCLTMENNDAVIAGFLNLEKASTSDDIQLCRPWREVLMHMFRQRNICGELKIDEYLAERGLYVFSEYRGKGIGCELLKCWELVCKELSLLVGFGIFTSKYSQKAAERAGLIKAHFVPYEEFRKVYPSSIPEGVEEHTEGVALFCTRNEMLL